MELKCNDRTSLNSFPTRAGVKRIEFVDLKVCRSIRLKSDLTHEKMNTLGEWTCQISF